MGTRSKKARAIAEKVQRGTVFRLADALEILEEFASSRFAESIDVVVKLGVDSRQSDQAVRGVADMPFGIGKEVRLAVFAEGELASAAREAGAHEVGMEDLAEKIQGGDCDFDVIIATPTAMKLVGTLGKVLGPRGLMPNPKTGTVTDDPVSAVAGAVRGQVRIRTDRGGNVHGRIGRVGFAVEAMRANLQSLCNELQRLRPSSAKGNYFRRLWLSTTMGPGIELDIAELDL